MIWLKVALLLLSKLALPPRTKLCFIFKPHFGKHSRLQVNTSLVDHCMENILQLFKISKPVFQISKTQAVSCVIKKVKKERILMGKASPVLKKMFSCWIPLLKRLPLTIITSGSSQHRQIQSCLTLEYELQYKSTAWASSFLDSQITASPTMR